MKSILEILLGIVLIAAVIYINFFNSSFKNVLWPATKTVLIGGIIWAVVMIALLLVILGFSELKE